TQLFAAVRRGSARSLFCAGATAGVCPALFAACHTGHFYWLCLYGTESPPSLFKCYLLWLWLLCYGRVLALHQYACVRRDACHLVSTGSCAWRARSVALYCAGNMADAVNPRAATATKLAGTTTGCCGYRVGMDIN